MAELRAELWQNSDPASSRQHASSLRQIAAGCAPRCGRSHLRAARHIYNTSLVASGRARDSLRRNAPHVPRAGGCVLTAGWAHCWLGWSASSLGLVRSEPFLVQSGIASASACQNLCSVAFVKTEDCADRLAYTVRTGWRRRN